ncbi:Calcium permeable stress-gated cation channel 1 [Trametes pubescens]|uniref:Calcium permeable stress-gated cation channel 1 n=1 Tax=Trametes pubescens TaxID=154538 RepID=A0A1M2VVN7_TRAPU|nr:Calcium permeable stress-gated cation channel 1 [Trametes pubescens]
MPPSWHSGLRLLARAFNDTDTPGDDNPTLPPGSPPTLKFEGPWFATQITLSISIGLVSFLVFSYCRTRWPLLFAPRTKLKGFSPHEAHAHQAQAFFGWIIPTIRISEFTVLQIVGLDAAVLLGFLKMSFWLFSSCSVFAIAILMPINLKNNIDIGDGREDAGGEWSAFFSFLDPPPISTPTSGDNWWDLLSDANSYLSVHLLFTYIFTILALRAIYKNFKRFVRSRQLFSLELVHSVPARTVMVSHLPPHLQTEPALAEYFEQMDLRVESVNVSREVGSLRRLLDLRTDALLKLESAWVDYLGNPSQIAPTTTANHPLVDTDTASIESQPEQLVLPNRKRPTIRPGWFTRKVDALEYYEQKFREADELVKKRRRSGRFKASHVAFVTFEKMSSAQVAAQAVHAPHPMQCLTHLAPEPRDIVWSNISHPPAGALVREWFTMGAMIVLQFFWFIPITALAGLLSYSEIKKTMPWLAQMIERNEHLAAIVQNSLPSVGVITLNATLPFLLEALTLIQGLPARSWIEFSIMKKYFLFLLVNVIFIFLVASTYWQLVRDLTNSPAKGIEKLADALAAGKARHFFVSYVILQGIGLMPLQLLNLGILIPRMFYRLFITRTPRDFAELNAPPMINYGIVYPQAILIFVITLLYSVIQPLILVFGAVYFGVAYVVYKYKLLFVFYKPYESQGQAWPITFVRLIWGVLIFIVFMIGLFILKKSFILASLLAPLLGGTLLWWYYTDKQFRPLSKYVSLSSVHEVERGEESADVMRLREGHPVTWSQSNLNRRRYAQNDETLYVAPEDERTDYSQPPMANWYSGVLNTGKRRYGHPAITGVLPVPWLPIKQGQSLNRHRDTGDDDTPAVVLTLRKKYSVHRETLRQPSNDSSSSAENAPSPNSEHVAPSDRSVLGNPWEDAPPRPRPGPRPHGHRHTGSAHVRHRLSFDAASGVIMLPEDEDWMEDAGDSDSDDYGDLQNSTLSEAGPHDSPGVEGGYQATAGSPGHGKRYSTYYHHPERRRQPPPSSPPQ